MWDYLSLQGAIRVDELIAEGHRIREASLHAMAVHKPSLLDKEELVLKARARRVMAGEPETRQATREELLAFGARMHADIAAGGVFDDVPPVVS